MSTVWPQDIPVTAEEDEYFNTIHPDDCDEMDKQAAEDFWADAWEEWMNR